jgi:hypothetical protein
MNKKTLKVASLIVIGALTAGLVGAGIHSVASQPVTVEVTKEVKVEVPVTKEVIKEVPVIKEVVKEVSVEDTAFKALACDRLLFDDISECVEEVKAEDAALKLALSKVKEDFADELENEDIIADEKDAELIKVYSAYEDLEVLESDFDDEEYSFSIKVKVEDTDEDEKFYALFEVEVKDGEAEIVSVEKIE